MNQEVNPRMDIKRAANIAAVLHMRGLRGMTYGRLRYCMNHPNLQCELYPNLTDATWNKIRQLWLTCRLDMG